MHGVRPYGGSVHGGWVVLWLFSAAVMADDPPRLTPNAKEGVRSRGDAATPVSVKAPKLLVLQSGRVVQGLIRGDERGYHIETPQASLYFPIEHVKFAAADLHEAHRRMSESMAAHPMQRDLVLARWCVENSLVPEAADHFRDALKRDPTNQEARQSLAQLENVLAPGEGAAHADASRENDQRESLSRLSQSAVKEYVSGVQPLLLARCGSLKCHGAADGQSFRLEKVRLGLGSHRAASSRNLAMVLRQVNPLTPAQSPLLCKGCQPHGGLTHSPLERWAAAEQKARLQRWLKAVGPELNRLKRDDTVRGTASRMAQLPVPRARRDPRVVPASAVEMDPARTFKLAPGIAAEQSQKADFIRGVGPLTDPFDPTAFNSAQQHQR